MLNWNQTPAIKICGLTREEEAGMLRRSAIEYAGMVLFYPRSKRNLSLDQAARILRALPEEIIPVAVTVSPTPEQVKQLFRLPFRFLQVHGELSPEVRASCPLPIWRAYNLAGAEPTPEQAAGITGYVLDAAGYGSGRTFDWEKPLSFDTGGRLFILAGGLCAENVAEGIQRFHPDVVDVSSGVEGPEGKDEEKIRRFAAAVRGCGQGR